jgi:membrane associated rhomboid family serine protease
MFPIRDNITHKTFPSVAWGLIVLNGIIFLFEISVPEDTLQTILYTFGLVPAKYSNPQWAVAHGLPFDYYLSFLTNMFLHGGWVHIIGNMWFLYLFGSGVEDSLGHWRFLMLYLLSGIAANVVFFIFSKDKTVPEMGASGAIAGIMGAYFVMFPRARILTLILLVFYPIFVEIPAFFYIGYWFILQLFQGTLALSSQAAEGGVAWWGHVGGFIAGVVLLPIFRPKKISQRRLYPSKTYSYR